MIKTPIKKYDFKYLSIDYKNQYLTLIDKIIHVMDTNMIIS